MIIEDFEYAGWRLSTLGYVVANISSDAEDGAINAGSQLTWNTVTNNNSSVQSVISTQYDEMYSNTFEIFRLNCKDINDYKIDETGVRMIMKWLNRKKPFKFTPLYRLNEFETTDTYYMGYFNVQPVYVGSNIVGFSLTFQATSPYAFGNPTYSTITSEDTQSFAMYPDSDEYGIIYADAKITSNDEQDITITNSTLSKTTKIANCASGEVITIKGESKQISSSIEHSKLFNDFNWVFPSFLTDYENSPNDMIVTGNCTVELSYLPRRKVGVM